MSTQPSNWDSHRKELNQRLELLNQREAAMSKHLRGQDGRHESDFGDRANYTSNDEVLEGLEDAALAEIAQIRGALARIEQGTYNECTACGDDIGEGRLVAVPHARMCVGCAAAEQR